MLLFRVHTWTRSGSYRGSGIALIRADNLADWLAHWHEKGFSVERVLDD